MASQAQNAVVHPHVKMERAEGMRMALFEGAVWGLGSLVPATLISLYANKHSELYRLKFSPSAKVATPLMIAMLFFGMRLEKVSYLIANDTKEWGYTNSRKSKEVIAMPFHHKALNWLYDHPFAVVGLTGAPVAGLILNQQLQLKHLKLQQRIMHSRIYAQGSILLILVTVMGFRHLMEKHGRFPDPNEVKSAEEEDQDVRQ